MALYRRGQVWHYDFSLAGRRYRGTTGENNPERAAKIEAILMGRAAERKPSLLPRRAPVLSEFAGRFLEWAEASQLAPKSKEYYRRGWELIRHTDLSGMRLDQIRLDDAGMTPFPGSPAYVNCALRTLRRMLNKAVEWGVIPYAPRIKLRKEYGRSTLIDLQSEAKLLAVAHQPLRDVLLVMLDTGMRPQEVFRMRLEHVDWQAGTIFIPHGKTMNSRRYVPMSQRVMEALRVREKDYSKDGWLFPGTHGPLTTIWHQFERAREAAHIPRNIVLYSARHTFATHALAATGNLAAVMKAMGHSNAQTAMIYQHPGLDAIRKAMDEKNLASVHATKTSQTGEVANEVTM